MQLNYGYTGGAKDYSLNAHATGVPVAVVVHTFKWTATLDMDKSICVGMVWYLWCFASANSG